MLVKLVSLSLFFSNFLGAYLKDLQTNDPDNYELLFQISKLVQNSQIDCRKFITLKHQVLQASDQKGRMMSAEEMNIYCKTLFQDFKFIDMVVQFCLEKDSVERNEKENTYTSYISCDHVIKLNEIIQNLPLIINKYKNKSDSIYLALDSARRTENEEIIQKKNDQK